MTTTTTTMTTTTYTCEIIIHRATHVPVNNLLDFSCDPYILATLQVPDCSTSLVYRTPTIRRTLNPTYDARWIVAGVPEVGFTMTLRLCSGQRAQLEKCVVCFPRPGSGQKLAEGWVEREVECKVDSGKRHARIASYHRARVYVSARVVGKTNDEYDRRVCTVGPLRYTQHFSPLIGYLIGSGAAPDNHNNNNNTTSFVANRLQLAGPPPLSLHHHYVGYMPFMESLFKKSGIKGRLLNHALRKLYRVVYSYDKHTVYGVVGEGEGEFRSEHYIRDKATVENTASGDTRHYYPGALARQFLRMTAHGTGSRAFTYVITLDGEWRFTETGDKFWMNLLSKHSMHADVARDVAFSGEFFVRRRRRGGVGDFSGQSEGGDADEDEDGDELAAYELVIDNSSGTYRPRKELLPTLRAWLMREENLGGLGGVIALDVFDERLRRWKMERREVRVRGGKAEVGQE